MFTTRNSLQKSLRWLRRAVTLILVISNATVMWATAASTVADTQPSFPIRAAFYYPWFPEAWNQQGYNPFTNYTPSLGFYDGGNSTVIKQHITAMQYGGIQAGIASWWGQGTKTDSRISALLQGAAGTSFRWSIYYEQESLGDPSVTQITNDLTYLRDKYGNDPSFLRIGGRFVVFVYASGSDACGMVDRWKQANTVGAYVVLKVFSGYQNCTNQPDGWHQYSPAVAADSQKGHSYAIAPGFWKKGEAVRLTRDLNRWNQNVRDMVASGAPFQLITTFNEWGEGTSVESAQEWASSSGFGAYLDALHNNGNGAQTQPTPTTVPPTKTIQPTATTVPPTQTAQPSATVVSPAPTFVATNTQAPNLPGPTATATANSNVNPTATLLPTFTASPIPSPTNTATAVTTGDPVIAAAGDIACDPADGNFNGGNGTANNCRQKAVSDLFVGKNFSAILTLGDTQYEDGALTKYQQSFDPSWGRAKNIIHPSVGNHEYQTAGASGYYSYFGAAAGDKTKGYYSYDIGAWHLIAMNSNCSQVGGCGAGSPQEQWLKADLAAHSNACTLAYWHHPRFSSGEHGSNTSYDAFWKDLYAAGADVVLNGHDHDYERFALQNPSGAADPNGIQEFVVGTGGKNHYAFTTIQANSVARNSDTYGVLKLTLHATSYDWQFVPEAGKTFTDSGTANCRGTFSTQTTATPVATNTQAPNLPPTPTPVGTSVPAPTSTTPSTSGTLTFTPSADAYVTSAIPNTNYGTSQQIRIDGSPTINGYLTFNVQGLSGSVASAKLRIYANSSSTAGCNVYNVPNTSWSETSITYANAPALGIPIGSSGAFPGATWITVDVTPLITGNGTFSLALTGINSTAVSLASRESGANAPQLVVSTATSSVPATATPAPTQIAAATNTPIASPTRTPTQIVTPTATKAATATPSSSSAIQHVFVVVMENHSYSEVWNTSSSPYITSLGNSYARATNYHANTHPSLPNYLDLYGGSNYGITTDCSPSSSCHINATNLADNLEAKGLTWKGYMESMPSPCYLTGSGTYAPKHNPMVYFDDIRNNATRCNSHDVPYTALASDLASKATTPSYAMIVPNLCNDMHDCSVSTGDTWLKNNLPAILNSPACTVDKCLLILTWDEDDSSQSNQVLTIFAGSGAKTGGVTSGVSYTHFSALRTIENIFGLPTQTSNDAAASPMNDLLR